MTRPNSARTAATIFLLAFATGLLTTTVSFNWDLIRGVPLRGRAATIAVSKALVEDEFLDFVHNSAGKISESDYEVEPGDVFCNRELAMSTIEAIGFDMDYTIAQYKPEFDLLAFDGALAKLAGLGYPPEVLHFQYKPERFTRGLVLDKRRGNILKMDRYKYVRVAAHGSRKLSREERQKLYSSANGNKMPTYTGRDYVNVDTLFHIVDAVIYEQLVDLKDESDASSVADGSSSSSSDPSFASFLADKSYFDLYTDVRRCVDLCHRDGVIKDRVAENPGRYIIQDPALFPMLEQFRLAGKKVFLLTNSLYDYTHVVMNYLYDGTVVSHEKEPNAARFRRWTEAFDVVICGSCKPAFLQDPYLSLFRVDPESQLLENTDGVPISSEAANARPVAGSGGVGGGGSGAVKRSAAGDETEDPATAFLAEGKVFQGGNWLHLHDMLGVGSGDRVLYVGDHTYSDILRSKRTLGWRTCLVIPELEQETRTYRETAEAGDWRRLQRIRRLRDEADREVDALALKLYRADMALMKEAELEQTGDEETLTPKNEASQRSRPGVGGVVGAGVTMVSSSKKKARGTEGEFREISNRNRGILAIDEDDNDDDSDDQIEEDDYEEEDTDDGTVDFSEENTRRQDIRDNDIEFNIGDGVEDEDDSIYDFERGAREQMAEELADQLVLQTRAKANLRDACRAYHSAFHPLWGQVFKAGFMDSRFAKQVVDYACIYTTRASDLGSVSPTRDFRPFSDIMPHDLLATQNDLGDIYEGEDWQERDDDGATFS